MSDARMVPTSGTARNPHSRRTFLRSLASVTVLAVAALPRLPRRIEATFVDGFLLGVEDYRPGDELVIRNLTPAHPLAPKGGAA